MTSHNFIPSTIQPRSETDNTTLTQIKSIADEKLLQHIYRVPLDSELPSDQKSHPLESCTHFKKTGRFGILEDLSSRKITRTTAWQPHIMALKSHGERDEQLVKSKGDSGGNGHVNSDGKLLTQSEYLREKKYHEVMFRLETDSYDFAKERYKLELSRLKRGIDSMDGGALWIGRALILKNKVWLALWSTAKSRFPVVLETCRQRGVFVDSKMEYRPPVSLPRPYVELHLDIDEHSLVWKDILGFALYGLKVHVVDLRANRDMN